MDIYVNIDRHHTWGAFRNSWMYVILSKLGQHVNEMIAVTVKSVLFFMVKFSYKQTKRKNKSF